MAAWTVKLEKSGALRRLRVSGRRSRGPRGHSRRASNCGSRCADDPVTRPLLVGARGRGSRRGTRGRRAASSRTSGEFSPTPPVKTSASSPPIAAAIERSRPEVGGHRRRAPAARRRTAGPCVRRGQRACRTSRQPEQSGAVFERRCQLRRRRPDVLLEPQHETRIEAARAGRHHEAIQGCEAHRRVDRAAAVTAASEAPAPRWQVTMRARSIVRPRSSAARREAYACDRPWKP